MGRMNKAISLQGIGEAGFLTELATQICSLNSNLSYETPEEGYYTLKWYGKPLLQWARIMDHVNLYLSQIVGKTKTDIGYTRYLDSYEGEGYTQTRTLYMIGMVSDNFLYLSFNPWDGNFAKPVVFFAAKVADTSVDDGYRILSSAINHSPGSTAENPGTPQAISKYLKDITTGATGYSIVHRLPYERSDSQTEIIPSKLILSGVTVAYTLTDAIDTTNIGMNSVYSINGKNYYTVSPNMAVLYNEK